MSRLLINCGVFCLGVMLAFVVALRGRLVTFANTAGQPRPVVSVQKLQMPSSLDRSEARLLYAKQRRSLLETEVGLEERLAILTRAMDEGTQESLQLLRKEHLRVIPDYRRRLLPRLKYAALESLFNRFSDADWRSWPVGALTVEGERTDARYFVDRISEVNSELGRTLETAAHLLHGMYVSISAGAPYPMKEDLQYLVLNAAEVLGSRTDIEGGIPTEPAFDPLILKDQAVELSFEQIRAELTKQFVREHGRHLEAQLALMMDLDSRSVDRPLVERLRAIIHTLSLHASAQFRAELLPRIVDSALLAELVQRDKKLARALANLYVVGVIDALDAGRPSLAKKLLMRSEETHGGLRAQNLLHTYFLQRPTSGEAPEEPADIEKPAGSPPQPEPIEEAAAKPNPVKTVRLAEPSTEVAAGFGLGRIVVWLVIIAGLGFIAVFVIAYISRQNAVLEGDGLQGRFEPDTTPEESSVTDPSALGIEVDDGDPDIDFGFGDFDERTANNG